jgi:hypothetical protein
MNEFFGGALALAIIACVTIPGLLLICWLMGF